MRRRRVTYRPSKSQAVFGGVVGIIFVCIGLFLVIPTFGLFGILWTLIAAGITGMNFYQAFGRGYVGLQTLYEQGLITQEEYDQKRRAILEDL